MNRLFDVDNALTAVDRLGRELPDISQAGALRKDRYVGMFYFLWLGEWDEQFEADGPFDVTEILKAHPDAGQHPEGAEWGPWTAPHHWGKPLYGYYFTQDEWVMRKHIEMLALAGVDFLVFDTTNNQFYPQNVLLMMRLLHEYQEKGYQVPKLAFFTNTDSGKRTEDIYRAFYSSDIYPDTWFYWDGKPFIIGKKEECSPEVQDFFTFREAQWPNEPKQKPNAFPWMEFVRPQRIYRDAKGDIEVINVSVAQHPQCAHGDSVFYGETQNWGRSYHHGHQEQDPNAFQWGYNFQEQWDYAISKDPKIIFVTGWNEWIAGRWKSDTFSREKGWSMTIRSEEGENTIVAPGYTDRPIVFVDCCDLEYSRDIEPMSGGYFDNYYLQLCQNIRRFKGVKDLPVPEAPHTILIDGSFAQWDQVHCGYRDYVGGNIHREAIGYGKVVYRNATGVNDLHQMKVASDSEALYFYAECAAPVQDKGNWMMLYLNTGAQGESFQGYGYRVRPGKATDRTAQLERFQQGAFVAEGQVDCRLEGCRFMLKIPRQAIGISEGPVELQFKWADNILGNNTIEDFYENGDTAPFGRFNYRYRGK